MGQIPKGLGYVKSIPFFLKIGSFVILLIALALLGTFLDKADVSNSFDYWGKKGRLDFGMFVIVVSWLVVIVMVVLFVTGLHEKVTAINWPLTVAINMVIWGLLLFIAGCVIADTARQYDEKKNKGDQYSFCDVLKKGSSDARCAHLVGSTVFCFIATIIFGVDAFLNFQIFRGASTPAAAPPAVPT